MPNRFTRVPEGAVPTLPGWAGPLVPPADAFMLLMLSRPATGSLRRTWVTPATLWLCLSLVACGVVMAVLVALAAPWPAGPRVVAVVGIIAVVLGSGCVGAVGLLQRRAAGRLGG